MCPGRPSQKGVLGSKGEAKGGVKTYVLDRKLKPLTRGQTETLKANFSMRHLLTFFNKTCFTVYNLATKKFGWYNNYVFNFFCVNYLFI